MKRIVQGGLLVALIATLAACQPVDREEEDVAPGIEELRDRFVEAYNRHDAAAVAALYTDDAVFVNPEGTEITGRDQIQRDFESFFVEARPQVNAFPIATEGAGRLGWEIGKYQLQLQLPAQPPPGETLPGEPAPLGAAPIGEPAAAAQPGEPGATVQPVQPAQPPIGTPQDQSAEGHYLIVLEREEDDDGGWLIRAHVAHPGPLPPQQPALTTTTPGQESPLQPPPATGPTTGEPARTRPGAAPPPTAPEPEEGTELGDDDLEPPPDDGGGSPGQ